MTNQWWRWVLGLVYIFAVATIWIAASFVVQSVVDEGVSPFLVTYICNSLFVVYIPLVELWRYLEDNYGSFFSWRNIKHADSQESRNLEKEILLTSEEAGAESNVLNSNVIGQENDDNARGGVALRPHLVVEDDGGKLELDEKGYWTRRRISKVSLLICPIWFLAQLTFNLSLKYTTVTSNTILSSSSSLFTFIVALAFLGEKFTWVKLIGVLLCMAGTIIVSLGDSGTGVSTVASNPVLGDLLALLSSAFYAVYITLIRQKLPDEDDETQGRASMAQFLGFLGLFNLVLFFPVALLLDLIELESISSLSRKQLGLIIGKGLLDNVLSDYLWAKAVLLTSTTVATAGLSVQVPLAAIVDKISGNAPGLLDIYGGAAIMIGFAGINVPFDAIVGTKEEDIKLDRVSINRDEHDDF